MKTMKFNEETYQKQELILNAARKVFRQKGFNSATVRDIADEAGVNHALINYYFKNKQNLLSAVLTNDLFSELVKLSAVVNDPTKTWREMLQAVIDYYTDYLLKDPDSQRFFFNEISLNNVLLSPDKKVSSMMRGSLLEKELRKYNIDEDVAVQLLINAISLTLSPVTIAPLVKAFGDFDDEAYRQIILERKDKIIPWVEAMYGIEAHKHAEK